MAEQEYCVKRVSKSYWEATLHATGFSEAAKLFVETCENLQMNDIILVVENKWLSPKRETFCAKDLVCKEEWNEEECSVEDAEISVQVSLSPQQEMQQRRARIRKVSAYADVRKLIDILAILSALLIFIYWCVALSLDEGKVFLLATFQTLFWGVIILCAKWLLHAFLDSVDAAVARSSETKLESEI